MKFHLLNRKVHYWASAVVAAPLLVVVGSGLLLQLKKQMPWVQPPELRGTGKEPAVSFPQILEICRGVPEARVKTWADINRLDVRPSRGMLKVWAASNWEIQIDAASGKVLQTAYRRSDLIESIHDGSWFGDRTKYWVFLPSGAILLLLWLTGTYLFALPFLRRGRSKPALARPPVREAVRSGFTLVEVLVVIGIIALLIAILLPSLSRARAKAKEVNCLSNARQLAMGVIMYTDQHRGMLPPSADYAAPTSEPARVWTARVLPYVNNAGVFSCPSVDDPKYPANWGERGVGTIGYTTATAYDPLDVEGFSTPAKVSMIQQSSLVPLFGDSAGGPTDRKYRGFTFDPYNGLANAGDPRLGTPLISDRDLVRDLSHLAPAQLKPLLARHNGRVVLIFADAHADSFTVKSILAQNQGAGLHWRFRPKPAAAP